MNICRSFLFLLVISHSSHVKSNTYQSYETLAQGLSPSEAWMMGANKLVEYMFVGPESACQFMSEMSASIKLESLLHSFKQQEEFESLAFDEKLQLKEFAYEVCIEGGLFARKPPRSMADKTVTSESVIDEIIEGNSAIVKAKFADGSFKTMHLIFEDGVWKIDGIIPK